MRTTIDGAVAVVTGAASGLGAQLVAQLVGRGARHVVASDIDAEGLERLVTALPAGRVTAHPANVTDPVAVDGLVERAVEIGGRVDLVCNNAGMVVAGATEHMDLAAWQKIVDVNFWGVVHGTQAAYRIMLEQPKRAGVRGHIVNTASSAGVLPVPKSVAYAATKHGVVGLSTSLRAEGAARGVRVSVAIPGLIATAIGTSAHNLPGHDYAEEMKKVPLRAISAEQAAGEMLDGTERNRRMIVFPASNAALVTANRLLPGLIAKAIARQTG